MFFRKSKPPTSSTPLPTPPTPTFSVPREIMAIIVNYMDHFSAFIFRCTCRSARIEVLQKHPNLLESSRGNLYRYCANYPALLEWLESVQKIRVPKDLQATPLCNAASASNSKESLIWLQKHGLKRFPPSAVEYAARHGHLDLVQWLISKKTPVQVILHCHTVCYCAYQW